MELLERGAQLATLREQFAGIDDSGRLVLVTGEAGAGKSALVEAFLAEQRPAAEVLFGRCDDLFAPRPLGPLADIARQRPGRLREALAEADQSAAFEAFLSELAGPQPVIVALEDLQWADEATLDLLRFVARRLEPFRCLVIATYRDLLDGSNPLRRTLASFVGPAVTRIALQPLSVASVRTLVGDRPIDPVALHARSGGNPFFVAEVLRHEQGDGSLLPATVRDAILGQAALLSGPARDALDAAAVLGNRVGVDLIEIVADCDSAAIDECFASGLLTGDETTQAFRHDLGRQAVEDAMTPLRRRQLHARALEALAGDADMVQRAHHAVGAQDRPAVVDLATRAADQCVALGAYTQAATLYGRALDYADDIPVELRRRLLEARARTCERVEQLREAIAAGEELHALLAESGDDTALSECELWLSAPYRSVGRPEDARRVLDRAISRLEPFGPSPALARSLNALAWHQLLSGAFADANANGQRALGLADEFALEETAVSAMDTCGAAMVAVGDIAGGTAVLREALDRAKRGDLFHEITRAAFNLGETLMDTGPAALALPVFDLGIAVAEAHELRLRRNCLLPSRARASVRLCRWDDAIADLSTVLQDPGVADMNRCIVLAQLGTMRARRGDPGAVAALEEALTLASALHEAQLIQPVRIGLAEAAWLADDLVRAASEIEAALPLVPLLDHGFLRELAFWAHRTGVDWVPDDRSMELVPEILDDDFRAQAAFWEGRGGLYEAADALGESDVEDDLRKAHSQLVAIGARPRAQQVARRLRELGARDVPRGPRPSTRANAAGLTARELQVAALLANGLTNGEVATRLVLSPKTVDHHVSAVLSKLGVRSRREVATAASALGIDLAEDVA